MNKAKEDFTTPFPARILQGILFPIFIQFSKDHAWSIGGPLQLAKILTVF